LTPRSPGSPLPRGAAPRSPPTTPDSC
jgi:hypothetical protein